MNKESDSAVYVNEKIKTNPNALLASAMRVFTEIVKAPFNTAQNNNLEEEKYNMTELEGFCFRVNGKALELFPTSAAQFKAAKPLSGFKEEFNDVG